MENKWIYLLLIGLLAIAQPACSPGELSPGAYLKYLADPDKGLVREKVVGDVCLRVKYMPPVLLAYNELRHAPQWNQEDLEDLKQDYAAAHTFVLTIGPAEEANFDVARAGVSNYQEYAERIMELNFGLKEKVWLLSGEERLAPALMQLEENYGLSRSRNIIFTFPAENTAGDLRFQFADEIFYTGINTFLFKHNNILQTPELKIDEKD